MIDLFTLSFDSIAYAALACVVLREVFVATLPDDIAGPGGWLVDTGRDRKPQ